MTAKKGLFITFEGIEGAGKSTLIKFVHHYLQQHHIDLVVTREMGGTPIADLIRSLILDHPPAEIVKSGERLTNHAELLLVFAARAQHVNYLIKPSLLAGKTVLCDRFTDSSFAYQGGGRGITEQDIANLEQFVQQDLRPDLTILFDVPVEVGMSRTNQRKNRPDRIESEEKDFFERVRQTYLHRAQKYPERFRVIDTSSSIDNAKNKLITLMDEEILPRLKS